MGIEGVADPDHHFGFCGERKNFGVEHFGAGSGESVSFVVAEFVKEARLGGFVGVGGVNAVDVGPDDQFVGVHDVSDDSSGEIGAVASEGGDAAIVGGSDKAGDHGNESVFEKRKQNIAAALTGLFEVRLSVAESVASEDKFRGADGHGWDAGPFECGGKEADAKALAIGGQAVGEFSACGGAAECGDLVKQIAAERLHGARYPGLVSVG